MYPVEHISDLQGWSGLLQEDTSRLGDGRPIRQGDRRQRRAGVEQYRSHLKSGDRLGLIGHNGAGESTLLRTLAGVYEPSSGEFLREGTVSSLIDPSLGIEADATGVENIMLRGLVMGMSKKQTP